MLRPISPTQPVADARLGDDQAGEDGVVARASSGRARTYVRRYVVFGPVPLPPHAAEEPLMREELPGVGDEGL